MKKINLFFTVIIGLLFIVFHSCDKDDSDTAWGNSKIYMPQASILNGGLSNEYPVPFNKDTVNINYEFDPVTKILKIPLGVYRSGLENMEAFSVKITADNAASTAAAQNIPRGLALPEGTYSLPNEVSVENGSRQNTFFLTVDLQKVVDANLSSGSKQLVLVVGISDPTKYELNEKLAKTTVVINARDFLGKNLLQGGDMEAGSEKYWKIVSLDPDSPGGKIEIKDGVMSFTNSGNASIAAYQAIEVEKDKKYVLKADMTSTAVTSTTFITYLGTWEPVPMKGYDTHPYVAFWTFNPDGCLANPKSGNLPTIACGRWDIAPDGTFTAPVTGKLYLVLKAESWGNIGKITLDNISITEKED